MYIHLFIRKKKRKKTLLFGRSDESGLKNFSMGSSDLHSSVIVIKTRHTREKVHS